MSRPSSVPTWATNTNYTGGPASGTPSKVAPSGSAQAEGWEPNQKPGAQNQNWWQNLVGQWLNWLAGGPIVKLGQQVLTASSGTYTPTAGTLAVRVRMVGGGGGGGGSYYSIAGSHNAAAGGGASGAYFEKWIFPGGGTAITGGSFTCGAAGTAGDGTLSGSLADGGAGGDSTIVIQGTTYTAKGGGGGPADNDNSSLTIPYVKRGGTIPSGTSSGDVVQGDHGGYGFVMGNNTSGYATASDPARGGTGGSGTWGIGGSGAALEGNGSDGVGYGAGGGGSTTTANGSADSHNGGAGTAGKIIVEEYG